MDETLVKLKLLIQLFGINVKAFFKTEELEVVDLSQGIDIFQVLARVATDLLVLVDTSGA